VGIGGCHHWDFCNQTCDDQRYQKPKLGYPVTGSSRTAAFRKRSASMPGRLHDADYAAFVEHLVATRKRLGITQADLSQKLNRPQSYVSKFERLERRLDVGEWRLAMIALGQDPAAMFAEVCQDLVQSDAVESRKKAP